jgi:hypothetical protein
MMYNVQDDVHNPSRDSFRNLCEADSQDGFDAYAYGEPVTRQILTRIPSARRHL